MTMQDAQGTVLKQTLIAPGYRTLEIGMPESFTAACRPGQFVHVRLPNIEASALRRPFSIYGAEAGILRLLYKTVGRGTTLMNAWSEGVRIRVLGPLGRGFPMPADDTLPVLIAGGYGVAPLSFLASRLPRPGIVLIGGRTAEDILVRDDFIRLGWEVRIATQDGSLGTQGLVTRLLDDLFLEKPETPLELFSCGPDGLLRAVGERAIAHGIKGWLSLDKHMVCGVGACLACVQKLRRPDGSTWTGRVCEDGPVFESREIDWA